MYVNLVALLPSPVELPHRGRRNISEGRPRGGDCPSTWGVSFGFFGLRRGGFEPCDIKVFDTDRSQGNDNFLYSVPQTTKD